MDYFLELYEHTYFYENQIISYMDNCYKKIDKEKFEEIMFNSPKVRECWSEMKATTYLKYAYDFLYLHYKDSSNIETKVENIDFIKMDASNYCVCLENGIYNTKKQILIPYSPKYLLFYKVNASFDKNAKRPEAFEKFIRETIDGTDATLLQVYQMIGYLLIMSRNAKCFFVLGTASNSGKSILIDFIKKLIGEDNTFPEELGNFGDRFSLGALKNYYLCYSSELTGGKAISSNSVTRIKTLTGDDTIRTERKCKDKETIKIHCKFVFATNYRIQIEGDEDGNVAFWNRMVYVPFVNSIEEENQDKGLPDKLWAERNQILTKALLSVRELIDNNFVFSKSQLSEFVVNMWQFCAEDTVGIFVKQICELDGSLFTATEQLYGAYLSFCDDKNLPSLKSERRFSAMLSTIKGLSRSKRRLVGYKNPRWGFEGIGISKS